MLMDSQVHESEIFPSVFTTEVTEHIDSINRTLDKIIERNPSEIAIIRRLAVLNIGDIQDKDIAKKIISNIIGTPNIIDFLNQFRIDGKDMTLVDFGSSRIRRIRLVYSHINTNLFNLFTVNAIMDS
jgi:hypothetical protein